MARFIRKKMTVAMQRKDANGMMVNEKLFADIWLSHRNGTKAYKEVHPTVKNDNVAGASACELLSRPHVAKYVQKGLDRLAKKAEMNTEWVLERYRKLIEFNIKDFMDSDGNLKPLDEIPENVLYAAHGFKSLNQIVKEGKNGNTKTKKTILNDLKFSDKRAVLDSIARYLGMFEKDNEQKRGPIQINVVLVD